MEWSNQQVLTGDLFITDSSRETKKKEAKNNNFSRAKQKNTYQISLATEKV